MSTGHKAITCTIMSILVLVNLTVHGGTGWALASFLNAFVAGMWVSAWDRERALNKAFEEEYKRIRREREGL
jgi:hypothetical protein